MIEIPKVKSIEVNPVGIVTQINMSELILRDQRAIQESILASPDLTNGILPLLQKLMLRYPEFSRSQIADMVDKYSKQVFAGLPSTEVKPIVTKVERALEKLRAADNSFAVIEQGYGLQIEMIGDKIPSKSDIASIVANLKLHPQLFVRLVYTGNNPEALQNVVKQVQDESDFSNRSIGIRFGIVTTTPNALSQELPKIPVSVYNLMNKFGSDFGLKQKPKNSVELKEHTSIIGSADGLKVAEIPFSSSIKINNDITSSGAEYDSDISIVRIAGGHMAVKSYSGLEPEIQATIRDNRVNASDFLSARLEALQSEIKAVIAVLIAA